MTASIGVLAAHLTGNATGLRRELTSSIADVGRYVHKVEGYNSKLNNGLTTLAASVAGFGSISVATFATFENSLRRSTALLSNLSDQTRKTMSDLTLTMSRSSLFSASELAQGYYNLSAAGLSATEQLSALPVIAKFATAGMMEMKEATELLIDSQNALGMRSKNTLINTANMIKLSDHLAKANTMADGSIRDFALSLSRKAGTAMRLMNMELEEGIAILGAYAQQGIKGSMAGNWLAMMIRDLTKAAIKSKEVWDYYGLSVYDASGRFRKVADILEDLTKKYGNLRDEQKKAMMMELGFTERSEFTIRALMGMSDQIREYEQIQKDVAGTNKRIADEMESTLTAQLTFFMNRMKETLIIIGKYINENDDFVASLKAVSGWFVDLSEYMKVHKSLVVNVAKSMIGLVKVFIALKTAQGAVYIFQTLSDAIKTFRTIGFSAITTGLKNLFKIGAGKEIVPKSTVDVLAQFNALKAKINKKLATEAKRYFDVAGGMSVYTANLQKMTAATTKFYGTLTTVPTTKIAGFTALIKVMKGLSGITVTSKGWKPLANSIASVAVSINTLNVKSIANLQLLIKSLRSMSASSFSAGALKGISLGIAGIVKALRSIDVKKINSLDKLAAAFGKVAGAAAASASAVKKSTVAKNVAKAATDAYNASLNQFVMLGTGTSTAIMKISEGFIVLKTQIASVNTELVRMTQLMLAARGSAGTAGLLGAGGSAGLLGAGRMKIAKPVPGPHVKFNAYKDVFATASTVQDDALGAGMAAKGAGIGAKAAQQTAKTAAMAMASAGKKGGLRFLSGMKSVLTTKIPLGAFGKGLSALGSAMGAFIGPAMTAVIVAQMLEELGAVDFAANLIEGGKKIDEDAARVDKLTASWNNGRKMFNDAKDAAASLMDTLKQKRAYLDTLDKGTDQYAKEKENIANLTESLNKLRVTRDKLGKGLRLDTTDKNTQDSVKNILDKRAKDVQSVVNDITNVVDLPGKLGGIGVKELQGSLDSLLATLNKAPTTAMEKMRYFSSAITNSFAKIRDGVTNAGHSMADFMGIVDALAGGRMKLSELTDLQKNLISAVGGGTLKEGFDFTKLKAQFNELADTTIASLEDNLIESLESFIFSQKSVEEQLTILMERKNALLKEERILKTQYNAELDAEKKKIKEIELLKKQGELVEIGKDITERRGKTKKTFESARASLSKAREAYSFSQMSDEKKLQTLMEKREQIIKDSAEITADKAILAKLIEQGKADPSEMENLGTEWMENQKRLLEIQAEIDRNKEKKAQKKQYADAVVTGSVEARSMGMKAYSQTKELTLLERIAKATESANKQPPLLTLGFY